MAYSCSGLSESQSPRVPLAADSVDEAFMQAAAMSAMAGVRIGHGGPFGAAVVRDGVLISCAHNMVLHRCDPCCHAEMNAISQACRALGTHDLSDCDLYTTCEPCPMCWGAVQNSRLGTAYLGVDRHTAAKYGFDDKVFYDEVGAKADESYRVRESTRRMSMSVSSESTEDLSSDDDSIPKPARLAADSSSDDGVEWDASFCEAGIAANPLEAPSALEPKDEMTKPKPTAVMHTCVSGPGVHEGMVTLYDSVLENECQGLFSDPKINRTLKRRFGSTAGSKLQEMHKEIFALKAPVESSAKDATIEQHEGFMRRAIQVAIRGTREGSNKEREPFAAIVVRNGDVVSEACNTVITSCDATATAEVNAIRAATRRLGTYNLEGCDIYCTAHPDLMSLGAILWSRISRIYCGASLQVAAQYGFEEPLMNFADLLDEKSGKRAMETVENVAKDQCENVFKEWSARNGKIY